MKKYIQPTIHVKAIDTEEMIATSLAINPDKEASQNDDGTYGLARDNNNDFRVWDDEDEEN